MRVTKRFITIMVILALVAVCVFLWFQIPRVNDIELVPGWQKIMLDGNIPSGAVVIVDEEAGTFMPSEHLETKRKTGFVKQGRINFSESFWVVTHTEVWVYYPGEYEFCIDLGAFNDECLRRLSELTGQQETTMKEFTFGH